MVLAVLVETTIHSTMVQTVPLAQLRVAIRIQPVEEQAEVLAETWVALWEETVARADMLKKPGPPVAEVRRRQADR